MNTALDRKRKGAGCEQLLEHGVFAAEVLADVLLGAAALADALDQVQISVAIDGLLAHKHVLGSAKIANMSTAEALRTHYLASQDREALQPGQENQRLKYMRPNIATVDVAIMAADLIYDMQ